MIVSRRFLTAEEVKRVLTPCNSRVRLTIATILAVCSENKNCKYFCDSCLSQLRMLMPNVWRNLKIIYDASKGPLPQVHKIYFASLVRDSGTKSTSDSRNVGSMCYHYSDSSKGDCQE